MNPIVKPKPLRVSLLSAPSFPLETLWTVWEQSRHNKPVLSLEEVVCLRKNDAEFEAKFQDTIQKLLAEDIPVTECLTFVFLIENMPISLREQLVRHRIGVAMDPRLGADIVPSVSESSWWSQTTRVLDLSNFYDEGMFFVPPELPNKGITFQDSPYGQRRINPCLEYHEHMQRTQRLYRCLVAAGVHVEDARQIIPLGMTHRITWEVNLKALLHIIGKRSCWIAQLGIWGDLIRGIADCLSREVHPMLRQIVNPPCIKGDAFKGCPFSNINAERIEGRDGVMAPCPLWLAHNSVSAKEEVDEAEAPQWDYTSTGVANQKRFSPRYGQSEEQAFPGGWWARTPQLAQRMADGRLAFRALWGRDVDTGERLPEETE